MKSDLDLITEFVEATGHLGVREAAELVDKSHQTVARWRRGEGKALTRDSRHAIKRALEGKRLAENRARAGQGTPLFTVSNHHVESCGAPPFINGDGPSSYHAYFENQFGEQLIFTYDQDRREGILRMGDAGWDNRFLVQDGFAELSMGATERLWLIACWAAATGERPIDTMERSDRRASAWAEKRNAQVREMLAEMNEND